MKRRAREEREESKEEIEVEKRNWEKLDVQFVGEDFRRSLFISPVPEGEEFPSERALTVTNLPFDITQEQLEDIFEVPCGAIQVIFFGPSFPPSSDFFRKGYANIIFHESESLETALQLPKKKSQRKCLIPPPIRGFEKYKMEFHKQIVPEAQLKKESDEFMARFDAEKRKQRAEALQQVNVPDEDGFIKVVRGGKKGTLDIKSAKPKKGGEDPMKSKVLRDFYAFQNRQKKREKLEELKLNFEADKERIARSKHNRRFHPY